MRYGDMQNTLKKAAQMRAMRQQQKANENGGTELGQISAQQTVQSTVDDLEAAQPMPAQAE